MAAPARALLQNRCACGAGAAGRCTDCERKRPTLQTRLVIGSPTDVAEHEAERMADRVIAGAPAGAAMPSAPTIRRLSGSEGAQSSAAGAAVPDSVPSTLATPGQPLPGAVRRDMERHFGHDFSQVRVHADRQAQRSAQDLHAQAWTVGEHIAFGAGQFAPGTRAGRHLLAHELTHVVQQQAAPVAAQRVQRAMKAGEIDVFEAEAFDTPTLKAYLDHHGPGNIEDHNDSDDKARRIVRLWLEHDKDFGLLTGRQRALLIEEMQSGDTHDDDERAILNILLRSDRAGLSVIFSYIDPKALDSDFDGDEEDDLRAFYDRSFAGGREQALKGSRQLAEAGKDKGKVADGEAKTGTEEAEEEPARTKRPGEQDLVVLLDPKSEGLRALSKILGGGVPVIEPKSPQAMAAQLKARKQPIGTMYVLSHGDDSASVAFGRDWYPAEKLAAALSGAMPAGMEPAVVEFRGCRIGMNPPGMEAIRAALNAGAVIGGTCWSVTTPLGSNKPDAFKAKDEEGQAEELKAAADALPISKAKNCILDRSAAAYIQAGGNMVAIWHTPRSQGAFDQLYSKCQTSLRPKTVDPSIVTKSQSSISHECQLIRVVRKE